MRTLPLLLLCLWTLAGCAGNEIVGVSIVLQDDGSAQVTTRSLATPAAASPAEGQLPAVTWSGRAALLCSQGKLASIQDLKFRDDSLKVTGRAGADFPGLRVRVQRGPNAGWVKALVPDQATRRALAGIYDPSGRTKEVGDVLRLEITAPRNIVGSSVEPGGRGITADRDGKRAFLLVPAQTALEAGEDLTWDITWADAK
ncbi:MAG: hypothetical protein JNN13_10465 [Planctomycetes bacterium]|nr:hypothetical protein [Planctomycetota bacterium]